MKHIHVVGAGTMGAGIAQIAAQAGFTVSVTERDGHTIESARTRITRSVNKLAEKGAIEQPSHVLERITISTTMAGIEHADAVVEAVFEDRDSKTDVLKNVGGRVGVDCLIATNTSAIPITELAVNVPRPERFVGLHFFNPVPLMAAVEVVRGALTGDEAFERALSLAKQLGKDPIAVRKDVAGFLLNRINLPSTIEAMRMVELGVGTVADIDRGVRAAFGRKMGIFETGDMVGLDVTHGALMALYEETRDPRWYPPMILRRKVAAGQLGRKTGVGWYAYDADGKRLDPA